jgi:hypothetical protein
VLSGNCIPFPSTFPSGVKASMVEVPSVFVNISLADNIVLMWAYVEAPPQAPLVSSNFVYFTPGTTSWVSEGVSAFEVQLEARMSTVMPLLWHWKSK